MSNRERWVIYPLLFLALGFALKPKFVPPENFKCQSIECDDLLVKDILLARRSAQIGTLLSVPVVRSTTVISSVAQVKTLNIVGDDGKSRMRMGTQVHLDAQGSAKADGATANNAQTFDSGRLELYGKNQKPILVLASTDDGQSGLAVVGRSAGQNQVILRASPAGGQFYLHDSSGQVHVFAGHLPSTSGIYVREPNGPNTRVRWLYPFDRSKLPKPKKPALKKPATKKPVLKKSKTDDKAPPVGPRS